MTEGRVLIGYMEEDEAIAVLSADGKSNAELCHGRWVAAVEIARRRRSPGNFESEVLEIPAEASSDLERVRTRLADDPTLKGVQWSFKLVEIDKLVTIQKQIYSASATDRVKDLVSTDLAGAVNVALNTQVPESKLAVSNDGSGFVVSSHNLNLNLMGAGVAEFEYGATKEKMKAAQLTFGTQLSYVRIVRLNGKCYLRDGYHRVYGLRERGFRHTPCILIEATDPSQIGLAPGLFSHQVVLSESPPLFRYFLDPENIVTLPSLVKAFRVRVEQILVPT